MEERERLVFDEAKTATANLYYALSGEWPEYDCPKHMGEVLAACLDWFCSTDKLRRFLGLGCERVVFADDDDDAWEEMIEGLKDLALDEFEAIVEALYADCSNPKYWGDVMEVVYGEFDDDVDVALICAFADTLANMTSESNKLKQALQEHTKKN